MGKPLLLDAPDTAENAAIVPVTIDSLTTGFRELHLLAEGNPYPLLASFSFNGQAKAKVSLRIKLNKSGPLTLMARGLEQYSMTQRIVRVAMSGCG